MTKLLTISATNSGGKRNNSDYVYDSLKSRILNGYYASREKITEESVARELNTTRNHIRTAFIRLCGEGLLTCEPHKGVMVKEIDLTEAMEIIDIRKMLEVYAIKEACKKADNSLFRAIQSILESMEKTIEDRDFEMYSVYNTQFHEVIYRATNQQVLSGVLKNLKTRLMRYQYKVSMIPGRAEESLREHYLIFGALKSGDVDGAISATEEHMESIRDSLVGNRQLLGIGSDTR